MRNFEHFGVMLDCSRNAVMKPEQVKHWIDLLAKMGYNTLELYAEDTYRIPSEPYFGYLRGGYTPGELRELDAYAASRGVELIPCVQTLAHFTNLVKLPVYRSRGIVDTNDILLAGEEETYGLIEKIIANVRENFTSRHINIGMDEAHMVGLGKYLDLHGYENRHGILLRHLERVAQIVKKYDFVPHMWSDMFFSLQTKTGYYGRDIHFDPEVLRAVPENVELTYWDYYHRDPADLDSMFVSHMEFDRKIWFAGGAWCWNGFAPLNEFSQRNLRAAMESAEKHGVRNMFITLWGDDGKECSFYAMLPTLYAAAQYAQGNYDEEAIKAGFRELFGCSFDAFMCLDIPNRIPSRVPGEWIENPCKSIFYNDPFLGFLDQAVEEAGPIDYAGYARQLRAAETEMGQYGYMARCLAALCDCMELRYDLGVRTRRAYAGRDGAALQTLAGDYGRLADRVAVFYEAFKDLWFRENKPFGFEVHETRLGGLILRLRGCAERLEHLASGKIACIEELEEPILPYSRDGLWHNVYHNLVSVSEL